MVHSYLDHRSILGSRRPLNIVTFNLLAVFMPHGVREGFRTSLAI